MFSIRYFQPSRLSWSTTAARAAGGALRDDLAEELQGGLGAEHPLLEGVHLLLDGQQLPVEVAALVGHGHGPRPGGARRVRRLSVHGSRRFTVRSHVAPPSSGAGSAGSAPSVSWASAAGAASAIASGMPAPFDQIRFFTTYSSRAAVRPVRRPSVRGRAIERPGQDSVVSRDPKKANWRKVEDARFDRKMASA